MMKNLSNFFYILLLGSVVPVQARHIVQDSDIFWDVHYGDTRAINKWTASNQDVNQINDEGQSVLIKAVIKENKILVRRLLNNCAINVNIVDIFGKTALDYAVQQENKVLVRMLLKKKAQVTTDFNAIKCRELALKRSGWRILGAMLLGIIGFGVVAFFGMGLVMAGAMSTNAGSMSGFYGAIGIVALCGVGVAYGSVKVAQKSDSDLYVARVGVY